MVALQKSSAISLYHIEGKVTEKEHGMEAAAAGINHVMNIPRFIFTPPTPTLWLTDSWRQSLLGGLTVPLECGGYLCEEIM